MPTPEQQQRHWSEWNEANREHGLSETAVDQRATVRCWLTLAGIAGASILEIGCGTGWLCETLQEYGDVTAVDIVGDVLARAQLRLPNVKFVTGDFLALPLESNSFDVVVTLDSLSAIDDQPGFIEKIAALLRPGGVLMLTTVNQFVAQHLNRVPPPSPDQVRRWVDRRELKKLLAPWFDVEELITISPRANKNVLVKAFGASGLHRVPLLGQPYKHVKEMLGLGWLLACRARVRKN